MPKCLGTEVSWVRSVRLPVVAVTETWFTKHTHDSCVEINGYSLGLIPVMRKDKSNRKGAGVCFCIKNGINFEECAFPSCNVSVEIK